MSNQKSSVKQRSLAGLSIIGLVSLLIIISLTSSKPKSISKNSIGISSTNQTVAVSNTAAKYKDGSYEAKGSYYSPGGQESVVVKLTLKDSKITDSAVTSGANDPTAVSYQSLFISNYMPYVIGKRIDTIKLHNIAGSSLTSQGFDQALQNIEKQAKI